MNTNNAKSLKIFSSRFSVALGNHFREERVCNEDTAQEWLKIFRSDEPNVLFLASSTKPRVRK